MTYTEAVKKAIEGDKEGWNFLCEETYKGCSHTALKMMGNKDDADDVLHDAYMRAFKSLNQLDSPEAFAGWMHKIVTTTALNAINSKKKKPVNFSEMGENEDGEEFNYDVEDLSTDTQPELHYTKEETAMLVNELLSVLNDEQRAAIIANVYSGITTKEIAESLGVSENTIKSRIKQGKDKMALKAEEMKKKGYTFAIAPIALLLALLKSEGKSYACELPKSICSIADAEAMASKAGAAAALSKETAKAGFFASAAGKVTAAVAGIVVIGGIATGIALSKGNADTANENLVSTSIESSIDTETSNNQKDGEDILLDDESDNTEDSDTALTPEKKKPIKEIYTFEGSVSYTCDYTYDSEGRVSETVTTHGTGDYVVKSKYIYGENGYTVEYYMADGSSNGYSEFDNNGNRLKQYNADGSIQSEAKYDINGDQYYFNYYLDGKGDVSTDGELDDQGRVVKKMLYSRGELYETETYTYNAEGQLSTIESDSGRKSEYLYDENGRRIAFRGSENKDYEYNDNGDLVKTTYSYASEAFPFEATVNVYDDDGNLLKYEVYYINDYETGAMYLMESTEYIY